MSDARTLTPQLPALKLLIDGQPVDPVEGGTLPVTNPATGQKLCDVPSATAADVDRAVKAARRAFESGPWSRMSARERGKLIRRLSEQLWQRREEFALVESLNNGKTFRDAVAKAKANLLVEGAGHSAAVHSNDEKNIREAGVELPVSRLVVNQASSLTAGGSLTNGFAPTTTLGCGSWGGNSISENLDYKHLMNVSRIGKVITNKKVPTDDEIFA